jgi:translocation and assembly module TamB
MHGALPGLDLERAASARVALRALPVSPFLGLGDAIGHPRGSVSGEVALNGPLGDPQLDGQIELKQVSLSVASIAQPLRDVNARIAVHGHHLELSELTARDLHGKLRLSGAAELARDWSGKLSAELTTDRFPIRRQGDVVGELTTKTSFHGAIDHDLNLTGDVRVREGRFWVTGDTGADVQPLDRNDDIHFVDAKGRAEARELASVPKKRAPRQGLSLSTLSLKSEKDVWFMHKSFSVQVGLDLKLLEEHEQEKLVGEVRIARGNLELLGKPFDIQKGSVRLTGDYPPDPELELKASFEPPAGQKLFVEVRGRASSPIVSFSGAADTPEEAIAIVSGVGTPPPGAEQQAQSDARAFATNLTAGLLSATARRRLGDWVPLLSVQSDATGTPSQARAGFDASKLIPDFLRPLARGAYVEGIVGNTHESRSGSVGLGVRLEVALPRDLLTSLGYGPGPTWATDLTWVP